MANSRDNEMAGGSGPARRVRVWDVPTRLFHWTLVGLVAVNLYTGNVGGFREMDLHMLSGYAILALVAFRLIWGLVGSRHSRFVSFVRGPRATLAYLRNFVRGPYSAAVGHNPLGGWSVIAMLTSLAIQAVTGLFANDDILTEGPLADRVSKATSDSLTAIHATNAWVLYALIVVHLSAIAIYLVVKKQNLIAAMITGRKSVVSEAETGAGAGERDDAYANPLVAAAVLGLCAAAVWGLIGL